MQRHIFHIYLVALNNTIIMFCVGYLFWYIILKLNYIVFCFVLHLQVHCCQEIRYQMSIIVMLLFFPITVVGMHGVLVVNSSLLDYLFTKSVVILSSVFLSVLEAWKCRVASLIHVSPRTHRYLSRWGNAQPNLMYKSHILLISFSLTRLHISNIAIRLSRPRLKQE